MPDLFIEKIFTSLTPMFLIKNLITSSLSAKFFNISNRKQFEEKLKQYDKMVEDFEDWKDEDLSTEELSYYIDVQTRVSKKLLEVSGV